MVSKWNRQWQQQREAQRAPHYGLRKLSVGVASVLLSTTLYLGVNVVAHADVAPAEATVTTPTSGSGSDTLVATGTPTTPSASTTGHLPQTGGEVQNALAPLGLAMLGLLSGTSLLGHRNRRKKQR